MMLLAARLRRSGRVVRVTCLFALSCVVAVSAGCGKPVHTERTLTPAEQIWVKAEYEYRTIELHTAYRLTLGARAELSKMREAGQGGLNYAYCLGILNGRLFMMARSLGDTNATEAFLKECAFYLNENRTSLRLPPTNYSTDAIEAMIHRREAKVHSAGTNAHPDL